MHNSWSIICQFITFLGMKMVLFLFLFHWKFFDLAALEARYRLLDQRVFIGSDHDWSRIINIIQLKIFQIMQVSVQIIFRIQKVLFCQNFCLTYTVRCSHILSYIFLILTTWSLYIQFEFLHTVVITSFWYWHALFTRCRQQRIYEIKFLTSTGVHQLQKMLPVPWFFEYQFDRWCLKLRSTMITSNRRLLSLSSRSPNDLLFVAVNRRIFLSLHRGLSFHYI